jgi:hypothetical protein
MGAGNGTLMACILDFIREEHPDVYERTRWVALGARYGRSLFAAYPEPFTPLQLPHH